MKKHYYVGLYAVLVAIVLLLSSTPVMADEELIEALDLDKDGQITIREAVAHPAIFASFGKIDRDGDGKISPTEMAKTKVILIKDKNISKSAEKI